MKGDPVFVVLKYTSWLDAAEFEDRILGAVVKEFLKPSDRYEPSTKKKVALDYYDKAEYPFVTGSFEDFVANPTNNSSGSVSISLGSIAGFEFCGSKKDAIHLNGQVIRWKRLQQHELFWPKLATDPRVQEHVPGWISLINIWPPSLVVGIMVCEDVSVGVEAEHTRKTKVNLSVPVSTIAAGAAGAPGLDQIFAVDDAVNPKLEVSDETTTLQTLSGSTRKSQIFALELRKVTTEWLSKTLKMGKSLTPKGRLLTDQIPDGKPTLEVTPADLIIEEFTDKEMAEIDA